MLCNNYVYVEHYNFIVLISSGYVHAGLNNGATDSIVQGKVYMCTYFVASIQVMVLMYCIQAKLVMFFNGIDFQWLLADHMHCTCILYYVIKVGNFSV